MKKCTWLKKVQVLFNCLTELILSLVVVYIFLKQVVKNKSEKIIANCFIQYWFAITSFLRKWRHNNTCAPAYAIKMAGVWFRVMPPEPEEDKEFTGIPGPKNMPPRNSSPLQYFLLFFNLNLIREVVRQTNRYEIYPLPNFVPKLRNDHD